MFIWQKKQVVMQKKDSPPGPVILCWASVGAPAQAHPPVEPSRAAVPPARLPPPGGQGLVSLSCSAKHTVKAHWVRLLFVHRARSVLSMLPGGYTHTANPSALPRDLSEERSITHTHTHTHTHTYTHTP